MDLIDPSAWISWGLAEPKCAMTGIDESLRQRGIEVRRFPCGVFSLDCHSFSAYQAHLRDGQPVGTQPPSWARYDGCTRVKRIHSAWTQCSAKLAEDDVRVFDAMLKQIDKEIEMGAAPEQTDKMMNDFVGSALQGVEPPAPPEAK
jgi:hypothetical protein